MNNTFALKGRKSDAETVSDDEDCFIVKTVPGAQPPLARTTAGRSSRPSSTLSTPAVGAPSNLSSVPLPAPSQPSCSTDRQRSPSIARSGCDSDDLFGPDNEDDFFVPDFDLPPP